MDSSNRKTSGLMDPNFELVIIFDYYDGPESGLAIYRTGEGVRFSSLGDSETRLQRAFFMEAIEGDWWPSAKELMKVEGISTPRRLIVAGPSQTLAGLEEKVAAAIPRERYVAVGKIDMSRLIGITVGEAEITRLRKLDGSSAAFRSASGLVRRRKHLK